MPKGNTRRTRSVTAATRHRSQKFWLEFWALADRDVTPLNIHYVWRGPRDEAGRPVFRRVVAPMMAGWPSGARSLAAELAWYHAGRSLGPDRELVRTCDREGCIRPDHHRAARRSGRAA
jgi:hypothetical protein